MAFTLPPLPWAADALEPHLDAQTQEIHHDKHHQTYVTKANDALAGTDWADTPVEELLTKLGDLPADKQGPVRNNAGGHFNHTLWWESLAPGKGGEPAGELGEAIASTFGSFADFQSQFEAAGAARFGSGWAWLVHTGSGLAIVSTANQDNPISDGQTPLLGVDVWEHAYYLKFQNRRPDYLSAVWNVVNWDVVADRYAKVA